MERPVIRAGFAPAEAPSLFTAHYYGNPVLDVMLIAAAQVAAEAAGRWAEAMRPTSAPAPSPGGEPDTTGGSWGTDAASESCTGGADQGSW